MADRKREQWLCCLATVSVLNVVWTQLAEKKDKSRYVLLEACVVEIRLQTVYLVWCYS